MWQHLGAELFPAKVSWAKLLILAQIPGKARESLTCFLVSGEHWNHYERQAGRQNQMCDCGEGNPHGS